MAVIEKRPDKKGNVKYRVLIRKAGKPTISKTFLKWQTAKDFANKTEADLEKGVFRAEKAILSDVIEQSFKVLDMPSGKARVYRQIDKSFGSHALKDLNREVFFEYVERRKNEVKASTINTTFVYFGTLLKFAETYMQLKPNIEEFKLAKEWLTSQGFLEKADRRTRRVTDEEIRAIEEEWLLDDYQGTSAKQWSLPEMMRFAVLTAMRRGEQYNLLWDELNADERTVGCWRKHPKGKVYSRVPLLAEAMAIIEKQKRLSKYIFNVSSNHAAKVFNTYRDKAGIKDLVWHDLRHEGVSRLTETGLFLPSEVAMFSGHRDIQMLQSYTHLRAETIVDNLKSKGL
tara:strand:+ start:260 stop:1288 length:1029 start_codon:yes stop_codon:yes gene_type:complete